MVSITSPNFHGRHETRILTADFFHSSSAAASVAAAPSSARGATVGTATAPATPTVATPAAAAFTASAATARVVSAATTAGAVVPVRARRVGRGCVLVLSGAHDTAQIPARPGVAATTASCRG